MKGDVWEVSVGCRFLGKPRVEFQVSLFYFKEETKITGFPQRAGSLCKRGTPSSAHLVLRWWWFSCSLVSNSCDPLGCSPPGSSAHGILQARILGRVAISFSRPCAQRWRLLGRLCWFSGPVSLEGLLGPSIGQPKSSFGISHHKVWLIRTAFRAKPRFCETSCHHAQHPPGCLRRGCGGPEMCQQDVCANTAYECLCSLHRQHPAVVPGRHIYISAACPGSWEIRIQEMLIFL